MFEVFKKYDYGILIPVLLLIVLGVALVYSATLGDEGADIGNTVKQIIAVVVGFVFVWLLSLLDFRAWKSYTGVLYVAIIVALIFVLLFGTSVRGSRSWFSLGGFQLQPAEFAKVILILVLAKYFARHSGEVWKLKHVFITGVYTLIPTLLIVAQPDLGSASVLVLTWFGMLVIAGIKKWQLAALAGGAVGLGWLAWGFALKEYQKDRIRVFLNPSLDPLGQGYNVTQAKIAIGSGGITGKGLGHGSQSQLNFLPEQHTDFIFAVLGEELGFLGCLFLLSAFGFLFFRLYQLARKVRDSFGFFLVVGAGVVILVQMFISIGMNIGLLPVTGVPMPFVSYGGSSILAMLVLIGLVQSVCVRAGKGVFPVAKSSEI